jgi:FtsP/CotA-like multicopper oxidase with cupredoxin domain
MRELDRRTLIRAGLAAGGAGVLGGCDPGGARPGPPSWWMAHCHNVYHEQSGMMGVIGYIT